MKERPARKHRGLWTENNMKEALAALMTTNISCSKASKEFSVPLSTLRRHLQALKAGEEVNFSPCVGRSITFDKNLEDQLVLYVELMDSRLMPFTRMEFLKFVYDLAVHLKLPHRFNTNIKSAGNKFYYCFLARHPNLSLRTRQLTSYQKKAGFNKTQVDIFFSKYTELVDKYKLTADRIFNCDEKCVSIVQNNSNELSSETAETGKNVNVLLTINADGSVFIPPMFIFPNKKQIDQDLKMDAPTGSLFVAEESGWISAKSFKNWLEMFVKRIKPSEESPVLLIVNCHTCHKDLSVILYAVEHHVHIISLPSHTADKMQPLDRAILQPFKEAYNQACNVWMREHHPMKIALKDIPGLVKTAFIAICRMDLSQSAFKCTGLWPINANVFTEDDFVPSEHFPEPECRIEEINNPNMELDYVLEKLIS